MSPLMSQNCSLQEKKVAFKLFFTSSLSIKISSKSPENKPDFPTTVSD